MVVQPTPALCRLLEYDGDQATVEVWTGTMHLPRVAMPAKTLRAEYLEPGMEFVWFITDPRPEPPPKITRDPSILTLAKTRIDLLNCMGEEDREEAKFKAVPADVVQKGAALFEAFVLEQDGRPLHDARYIRLFDDLVRLLEPYDLLKKYRDVLLDRMIVRGREAAGAKLMLERRRAKEVAHGDDVAVCAPPMHAAQGRPYERQLRELGWLGRVRLRFRLAWMALFSPLPPKAAVRDAELEAACRYTLAQEFDDVCWLDFYLKIAKILGVEYDPKLLPRDRFLKNCGRFYDSLASGRPYERDPAKECCDGPDGPVPGGGGSQPRHPLPVQHGPEAGR